ncbi:MAG: ABC transporter [Gammaproteobacteria bacterium HGW-Gammaproteobacteria-3]|nr:MAG: ABC transporter [Gammaproteobacteria bacterium HGW-Gammaproteobacteria-3]
MDKQQLLRRLAGLLVAVALSGCAGTSQTVYDARDPWQGWNRDVQSFNDGLDDYVMKPVAKGYQWVTPSFVDRGVTNFFSNIDDIGVTINDLLQFKLAQTGSDGARFLVNTTAGVAGLFDVATLIDLPKHNEDFDQTLGVWGVPMGPYLVLPFFGPSSPRGVGGLVGDVAMNPITYINSLAITGGLFTLNAADERADNLTTEKIATEAAVDRYDFFKNAYLQQRRFLVLDGNVPEEEEEIDLNMDLGDESLRPVNPY